MLPGAGVRAARQLASTHDGIQCDGEDGRGAGRVAGVIRAELALRDAADLADKADGALMLPLAANGVIRWYDYY
ncbi:hypothetical protein [Cryobacterium zhongshanensis]|uniref:Uncharacterized protein n=1 Tax=Cryobacterium zhongshanensis TaxID=2928153 RepID=A0AA41UH68_9MICO|nr:hypothetical protein [Cryobacterium zhongshanensis]MCI4658074.1 hypothetical protein [Cryobacterium zhongshanensis]